jgi:RHS repeat-associated protein
VLRDRNADTDGLCDDERLYYTTDANQNVTALVDTSGAAVERYVYDPYGKVTIYSGDWSSTVAWADSRKNEILYCGYRYDPETGMYHVRNREYQLTLGRWTPRKPNTDVVGWFTDQCKIAPSHASSHVLPQPAKLKYPFNQ